MNSEGKINSRQIFIIWWYRDVRLGFFDYLKRFYAYLFDLFSVKICLSTLFSPWKRDFISTEGLAIQDRFQVLLLNLTSRLVGAIIKTGTVFAFILFAIIFSTISIVLMIVWFFYPIIPFLLIGFGLKLMFL